MKNKTTKEHIFKPTNGFRRIINFTNNDAYIYLKKLKLFEEESRKALEKDKTLVK